MLQLYPRLGRACASQRTTQHLWSTRFAATSPHITDPPRSPSDTGIRIRNSLTKKKEPLCTIKPGVISWYQCGPTVYDTSHIGHACTYVRFDVIRRLLQNHFGLQVIQVQGLTDVDDKIIARAASTSQDPQSLARTFELEYAMQMDSLNVLPPTLQLRVSESTHEIVEFIEGICNRGHAYTTHNGVYFDTSEFGKAHQYGKLQPKRQQHQIGNEHESKTTDPDQVKKSSADFSLWKSAKPGELSWPSPWGEGRPGWHIECSAMASKVFGKDVDLHTGGQDLAFPHHENEMAQSESFHNCSQWGNVYLHSGHVMLQDLKISKSVGNVISIESILNRCSADDFRLLCLLTKYHKSFNFNDELLERAMKLNRRLEEFFVTSQLACETRPTFTHQQPWSDAEHNLFCQVAHTKALCDEAFRDDFDTPTALKHIGDLVTATNRYIQDSSSNSVAPILAVRALLETTLRMLGLKLSAESTPMEKTWTTMVNATSDIITSPPTDSRSANKHDAEKLQSFEHAINDLVDFRATVRQRVLNILKSKPDNEELKQLANDLMHDCDSVRDKLGTIEPQPIVLRDTKDTSTWRC